MIAMWNHDEQPLHMVRQNDDILTTVALQKHCMCVCETLEQNQVSQQTTGTRLLCPLVAVHCCLSFFS